MEQSDVGVMQPKDLIMEISDLVFSGTLESDVLGDVMSFADLARLRKLVEELEWRIVVKPVLKVAAP